MVKCVIKVAIGCLVAPLMISNYEVQATTNYIEEPMAGVAVVLSNYYETSQDPKEELETYLKPLNIEEEVSPYVDIAISKVSNYVNIRSTPDTEGEIVGKIYNNSAATILESVEGQDGEWYHIKSGTVKGYMKAEFFLTGDEAEAVAKEIGTVIATVVDTATLRLREEANVDSNTLSLLAEDSEYIVLSEDNEGFAKIQVDNDLVGYVSTEYIDVRVDFEKAISIEEERAKLEEEARLKREAEEAIRKAEEAKKKAANKKKSTPSTSSKPATSNSGGQAATPPASTGSSEATSATRAAVVAYARQFLGNPYVYGGTSLTSGADCSGFTMSVYRNFGVSTGRDSRSQASNGRTISLDSVQPGDLIFYASGGSINHVAMYIGGGQVIHASTAKTGIKISNMYYRTPYKAASFLN